MCESVGKTDLLSDHFDSKQSREAVDLPLTCHTSPSLTTFLFRSSEVRHLLLDLNPADVISPKTPAPHYQPIDRKKRKGKRVEDYSRDRAA